jgi:peroxiredoxin
MMRFSISNTVAAAATLVLTAGAMFATAAHANVANGAAAPAFSEVDSNGKTVKLSDFAGKTVVLEWTNHQCPFVVKHYATGNMQATQKAATKDGVVWLSVISSAAGKQGHVTGAGANEQTKLRGAAPSAVLIDEDGSMGRAYGAKRTPQIFVINPQGKVVYQGAMSDDPRGLQSETPEKRAELVKAAKNYPLLAIADVKAGRPVATAATEAYGCSVKY